MEEANYRVTCDKDGRVWLAHKGQIRELSLHDLAALAQALCESAADATRPAERESVLAAT